MTAILAIDPGNAGRGCACAAWDTRRLVEVWFEKSVVFKQVVPTPPAWKAEQTKRAAGYFSTIVVERVASRGPRDSATWTLVDLSLSAGLVAGAFAGRDGAPIVAWPANDSKKHGRGWKGPESKPHCHRRLWALLDEAERRVLGGPATGDAIEAACEKWASKRGNIEGAKCYASDVHNLLDAAALGARFVGRMARI